jgi:Holliday junction resolvasome RuvABC DNA-binding subunit
VSFFADIDIPISFGKSKAASKQAYDEAHVDTLISFGFSREAAQKALKEAVSANRLLV